MEKSSEMFSELKDISEELEILKQYVKTTIETLENNFNSFVRQIDLLSELVDFQRNVTNLRNADQIIHTLFEFMQRNVNYDDGFLAFRIKETDEEFTLLSNRNDHLNAYRAFVRAPETGLLKSIIQNRDLAYMISNVRQFSNEQAHWNLLKARSVILFPIKIRSKPLGFGMLIRRQDSFDLKDLSFMNLIIGSISLIVYQHYYFTDLKARLFKQFRLTKILEDVKYTEYFEKGPLCIFTLDPRYVILHANTAALSRLKANEVTIVGENFLELIPKAHRNGLKLALDESPGREVKFYRCPIQFTNGLFPILEFHISGLELQNQFDLILVFAVDVTEEYYEELAIRRKEMMDELNQFSRILIGDYNNLLTLIVPNISLMRTSLNENNPLQSQLETMEKATKRSSSFIRKFLNYDLEEFEISEVSNPNNVIKSFIRSAKSKTPEEVDISFHLDAGVKEIEFYPLRIRRLLEILLDNSLNAVKGQKKSENTFFHAICAPGEKWCGKRETVLPGRRQLC